MRIAVNIAEKVNILFEGLINMKQEITINKEDAKKLGKILLSDKSEEFNTK